MTMLSQSEVTLTPRQIQCLRWVMEGKSSTDIATIIGLSPATVDEHLAGACERLGVRTRTQAVIAVIARRLLPPDRS